ncbi:methylenetetrahydrofolate reductase [Solirubrobacter ginsenosidimutans]|uniref:Methylenetetrahydrofolate reductase n=1 Tax=Solirubrobacter ginsenosidimutans TaxID=490573 RepID=A0A9X3N289_9ACTN|nr:methylenetetrahydrofolate reductase [Solirubrobacter ginsenosidimutans]MDA0167050.1 methylenetetrahydrofolate reductase [Solirubrobacter ginsenosidimutans]
MTATELIARAPGWSVPRSLAVEAVVNPFAEDLDRELRLLQRKVAAGATFVQSQMVFDLPRLEAFLARELAAGLARVSRVDALHAFPLGAEAATREVAAEFRVTRGINSRRR